MNRRRLLRRVLVAQANVRFHDFCHLVEGFGFQLDRVRGSHHIYLHPVLRLRLNLQALGGDAKPWQIRDFLALVETHKLELEDEP